MQIIALINQKYRVGKTTCAIKIYGLYLSVFCLYEFISKKKDF